MKDRRRFDARDFRWAGPEANGRRDLDYIALPVTITIPMLRADAGAEYSVGPINEPNFRPTDRDAFQRRGGLEYLAAAAHWFANSR